MCISTSQVIRGEHSLYRKHCINKLFTSWQNILDALQLKVRKLKIPYVSALYTVSGK